MALTTLEYFNALRVQGWVGDLAMVTETQAFGGEQPVVEATGRSRS